MWFSSSTLNILSHPRMWLAVYAAGATDRILLLRRTTVFVVGLPPSPPPSFLLFRSSFLFLFSRIDNPSGPWLPLCRSFLITLRRKTPGVSPPDERAAGFRDLYLATRDTHREISMPPAGFEPAIPASERPHTHDIYRTATSICVQTICYPLFARGQWRVFVQYRIPVLKYVRAEPHFWLLHTSTCPREANLATPSILRGDEPDEANASFLLPACCLIP